MTDDAAAQFAALLGHTTPQPTEDTTPTDTEWGNGRRPPRPDRSQASGGNQPEVIDPVHFLTQALGRQSGGMWRDL